MSWQNITVIAVRTGMPVVLSTWEIVGYVAFK
jgi:hypothetical protein